MDGKGNIIARFYLGIVQGCIANPNLASWYFKYGTSKNDWYCGLHGRPYNLKFKKEVSTCEL